MAAMCEGDRKKTGRGEKISLEDDFGGVGPTLSIDSRRLQFRAFRALVVFQVPSRQLDAIQSGESLRAGPVAGCAM